MTLLIILLVVLALLFAAALLPLAAQADVYESTMILVNKQNCLPSSYEPSDLTRPDVAYAPGVAESRKQMREEAARALEAMFGGAQDFIYMSMTNDRDFTSKFAKYASKAQKDIDKLVAKIEELG